MGGSPLPRRDELMGRLAAMLAGSDGTDGPAVVALGIDSYTDLISDRGTGPDAATIAAPIVELTGRLDRIVRRDDVIGWLGADTLGVISASLSPQSAGAVMDRLRGAFAMPIDVADGTVSLPCSMGVAFVAQVHPTGDIVGDPTHAADQLLARAVVEMERDRRRRGGHTT